MKQNKIKLYIISFLLLVTFAFGQFGHNNVKYKNLSMDQRVLLKKAYKYGAEFNVGLSMAAIMWQESFVGHKVVPFNVDDPSGGYWHKHLDYYLREQNLPVNSLNRNIALAELINNMDLAAAIAIKDIEYWQAARGQENWIAVWASYNGGGLYKSPAAQAYAKAVAEKVKILQPILEPKEVNATTPTN